MEEIPFKNNVYDIDDVKTSKNLNRMQAQEILDLTQKGDPDDIERNEFIYKPLTGEVGEEYAQGDYDSDTNAQAQWSNWNAMKQKQALNANLQEQWRAEKEASDQSFLVANSGGLANLFRVKNQ